MDLTPKIHHILPKSYLNSVLAAHQNSKTIGTYGAP